MLVIVIVSGVISYKVVLNKPALIPGERIIVVKSSPPDEKDSPRPSEISNDTLPSDADSTGTPDESPRTNTEDVNKRYREV
jgi:hypothetical protein